MSALKMPRRTLVLTDAEEAELVRISKQDPRAYMRERALALLAIAHGISPHRVATSGRLGISHLHHPETVYGWLNAYLQHRQLRPQQPRRGPFSPSGRRTGSDPGGDPSSPSSGDEA